MNAVRALAVSLALLMAPIVALAQTITVENVRVWRAPDHTRLVLDVSRPPQYHLFGLDHPPRLVIDLDDAVLRAPLPPAGAPGTLLAGMRAGRPGGGRLRIVLDLRAAAQPHSFVLRPAGPYGYRLVVDLFDPHVQREEARRERREAARLSERATRRHELVIAIDPGHGGDDPGATGPRYHTKEKNVTLAIARDLARLVAATPGMHPVLTRTGDYYIGLRDRYRIARRYRADAFVSIHADAIRDPGVTGASVYALSEKGASDAIAQQVADKENASDLIGGVSLSDKDNTLTRVLLDLSHTKTIQDSLELGQDMLAEIRHVEPLHMNHVGQAGFVVLEAPDVPSVLIETAFITNPAEERKLRTRAFQHRMAAEILAGLKRYFAQQHELPPRYTAHAASGHVVRTGETWASIARRYHVRVQALRALNDAGAREPHVGSRLRIPRPRGAG